MRAVVQRVTKARVTVENQITGEITKGLLIFLGIGLEDKTEDVLYLASKIANLRVFEDSGGKMNCSLLDIKGEALVVSQFTLYGDCRHGRRPSFSFAAPPEQAKELYEAFINQLQEKGIRVAAGKFQAHMLVENINDGPVTLLLDSKKLF